MSFNVHDDNYYISFDLETGQSMRELLNLSSKNFSDMRNLMVPAIKQGFVYEETVQENFLLLCVVKSPDGRERRLIISCSVNKGAPDPNTPYTLRVTGVMTYKDGVDLMKRRITLSRMHSQTYQREKGYETVEGIELDNRVTEDGVVYDGEEYRWSDMDRPSIAALAPTLENDIKRINLVITKLRSSEVVPHHEIRLLQIEAKVKGIVLNAVSRYLHKTKPKDFIKFMLSAFEDKLPPDLFQSCMDEARRRRQEYLDSQDTGSI